MPHAKIDFLSSCSTSCYFRLECAQVSWWIKLSNKKDWNLDAVSSFYPDCRCVQNDDENSNFSRNNYFWKLCKFFLSLKGGISQKLNKFKLAFLKMTRTVIYYYRRQPYFFYRTFIYKKGIGYVYVMVDFICMGFLGLQGANARITKWKIRLAHSGTRTHDPWIVKPPP